MTSSILTSIVCVVRTTAPAVVPLRHVLQLLDALLDVSMLLPLPQAAASGHVRLFDRVFQRIVATTPQMDEFLLEFQLSKAMEAAVQHGHLDIVQRIHALHPDRLPVEVLPIATEKGHFQVFQWLLAHRIDGSCTPDPHERSPIMPPPSVPTCIQCCCLRYAHLCAIKAAQVSVCKWLLDNGHDATPTLYRNAGDAAAAAGNLEMVRFLHSRHDIPGCFTCDAIDKASAGGHVEIVFYLLANRCEGFTTAALNHALIHGYEEISSTLGARKELLHDQEDVVCTQEQEDAWGLEAALHQRVDLLAFGRFSISDGTTRRYAMTTACRFGHLDVAQWLVDHHKLKCHQDALLAAAGNGHLHILQWLHDGGEESHDCEWGDAVMDYAAHDGHLATIQWLHANRTDGCSPVAMDLAAANGHLEVVQWLHTNRTEGCTHQAMDSAAEHGHMDVVLWLHANRSEGCTRRAMDAVAREGRLDMVQWFHANRTEGCTTDAMNHAARFNHQHVVEWLHCNRTEGCTASAMDGAAVSGHLEMVQWLHLHRQEGCTKYAMDSTITSSLSILKWLHFNRHEGCTIHAMHTAATRGDFATVAFLQTHRTEGCSPKAAIFAAERGHLGTVQYLHEWYPQMFEPSQVLEAANKNGHSHIVGWLKDQELVSGAKRQRTA